MKTLVTFILAVSFISIAVFGFFAMNQGHHDGCIAATARGVVCEGESTWSDLQFHLNTFKSFSTATVGMSPALLLMLSTMLISFAALLFERASFSAPSPQFAFTHTVAESPRFSHQPRFTHWLSLFLNSPNVL